MIGIFDYDVVVQGFLISLLIFLPAVGAMYVYRHLREFLDW